MSEQSQDDVVEGDEAVALEALLNAEQAVDELEHVQDEDSGEAAAAASGTSEDASNEAAAELEDAPAEAEASEGEAGSDEAEPSPSAPADESDTLFTTEEFDVLLAEEGKAVRVVDEIARLTEAFESMRDTALDKMQSTVRSASDEKREFDRSMQQVLDEFQSIRREMAETGKVAQDSVEAAHRTSNSVKDLHDRFSIARATQVTGPAPVAAPTWNWWLAGGAIMALSWAAVFFVKTGNATAALAGVVVANLFACTLLLQRR